VEETLGRDRGARLRHLAAAFEKALWEFGYGTDRTTVVNYWSDDSPVAVNDPENNKWLLVARKDDHRSPR